MTGRITRGDPSIPAIASGAKPTSSNDVSTKRLGLEGCFPATPDFTKLENLRKYSEGLANAGGRLTEADAHRIMAEALEGGVTSDEVAMLREQVTSGKFAVDPAALAVFAGCDAMLNEAVKELRDAVKGGKHPSQAQLDAVATARANGALAPWDEELLSASLKKAKGLPVPPSEPAEEPPPNEELVRTWEQINTSAKTIGPEQLEACMEKAQTQSERQWLATQVQERRDGKDGRRTGDSSFEPGAITNRDRILNSQWQSEGSKPASSPAGAAGTLAEILAALEAALRQSETALTAFRRRAVPPENQPDSEKRAELRNELKLAMTASRIG